MKFYNPFKAHIVQTEDDFFIRKFHLETLQWQYLERDRDEWYFEASKWRCSFKDISEARHALLQLKLKLKVEKIKNKEKYIES